MRAEAVAEDDVVGAFDELSRIYDATREPPDAETLVRIARVLREWRVERFLEVGVGTGRMAVPLLRHGFEVTGIDASPGMLGRARAKGIERLVRGTAYALPFPEGAFDATLFVHVLHLLERPGDALREACRVAREGAVALVEPVNGADPTPWDRPGLNARRIAYDALRRLGVDVPARAHGPRARERTLLQEFPPDRLAVVSEGDVTARYDQGLDLLERRASRWTLHVPPDLLAKAVAEARRAVGDRTYTYHRVRALAFWSAIPHPAGAGPP